jgi:ribose 5-phosphate isomerase B
MLFLVSDHAGFDLKQQIKSYLISKGVLFQDLNPVIENQDDYPDKAHLLSQQISANDLGIALCGTGQGICIALNRYKNIRAGIGYDPQIVKLIRQHNHANVLCLPGRFMKIAKAMKLIEIFLNTQTLDDLRHLRRINKLY